VFFFWHGNFYPHTFFSFEEYSVNEQSIRVYEKMCVCKNFRAKKKREQKLWRLVMKCTIRYLFLRIMIKFYQNMGEKYENFDVGPDRHKPQYNGSGSSDSGLILGSHLAECYMQIQYSCAVHSQSISPSESLLEINIFWQFKSILDQSLLRITNSGSSVLIFSFFYSDCEKFVTAYYR
jgi:hypothetical protein